MLQPDSEERRSIFDFDSLLASCPREKDKVKVLILKYIFNTGQASRKMVTESLSLRPTTVSKSIVELLGDGVLTELPQKANAGRGRPEWFLEINPDRFWAVTFCIMSMNLITSIVNFAGRIVEEVIIKLDKAIDTGGMAVLLNSLMREYADKVPPGTVLLGYGVAVPGLIDKKAGLWRMASRFPLLKNLRFEDLARQTGGTVLYDRNVDAILHYCLISRLEARQGTSLLLHWGYGIAISLAMEGSLIQSTGGLFGEIGHWSAAFDGSRRTIEELAAIPRLIKLYQWSETVDEASIHRNVEDGFFPKDELDSMLTTIADVLKNVQLAFFPDTIYILSPFVNQGIADSFTGTLAEFLKPFEIKSPRIVALDYSMHSESLGMAYTLFSRTILPYLAARW